MRALRLQAVQQPVQLVDRPKPEPEADEVLIALDAAALNHRDAWIQLGLYPGIQPPVTLGSDGAGHIEGLGSHVPKTLESGQAVLINPAMHWGDNPQAQAAEFSILGLPRDGTFASHLTVPHTQVHPIPPHLNTMEAAALPLAGLTAYRALFTRGAYRTGQRVLITGIGGGVALMALQLALAADAQVWVTSSCPEKIAKAEALGASGGWDYKQHSWGLTAAKETGGFDLVIDGAGGSGYENLIDAVVPGGRIIHYGATAGNPPEISLRKLFWKQITIGGTTMGSPDDFFQLLDLVSQHRITPVIDSIYPLKDGQAALDRMHQGGQFGKILLDCRRA